MYVTQAKHAKKTPVRKNAVISGSDLTFDFDPDPKFYWQGFGLYKKFTEKKRKKLF